MRLTLTLLLSLLFCSPAFAYNSVYNYSTGGQDYVGVEASSDVSVVCASGKILKTTGSGTWACADDIGAATDHSTLSNLTYAAAGHTGFAPALGADDNYVTDAEKIVIGNTSGTNSGDQTNITGNAATVTNATLTTALTVNTGTVTLVGNVANTSALTIGAGAVSVSGSNTGDQTTVSGNAGTATALAANGANCDAGNYPLGVDASGASEGCTVAPTAGSLSVDDLITLSGVAEGSTHLGTFTGTTIADNQTIKAGLQALETSVETKIGAAGVPAAETDAKALAKFGTLTNTKWCTSNGTTVACEQNAPVTTESDPTALLTAGTDNVKDTHLDFGTGAGQVSASDMPNEDIGDITITTGDWAVEDDSHAHVIGNIDSFSSASLYGQISDETGSASGSPLAVFNVNPTLTGATMAGDITLGENTSVALDPAGSADEKWSGITVKGTAGATLAVGDLIYLDVTATEWLLADADAAGTSGSVVLGLCILAANDGQATNILLNGTMRSASFPASIALGAPVYADVTAGDITATQPTGTDDVIRIVGWTVTAEPNTVYFNPSQDYFTHT